MVIKEGLVLGKIFVINIVVKLLLVEVIKNVNLDGLFVLFEKCVVMVVNGKIVVGMVDVYFG